MAALLLLVVAGMGCSLDRDGLTGGSGSGGRVGQLDAGSGDAPAGDAPGSMGGQSGKGGGLGGMGALGGNGAGGAAGSSGGAGGGGGFDAGIDVMSPQDAVDAAAPPDAPMDLGGGGPDTGAVDRPAMDVPTDSPVCSSNTFCDTNAVTVTLPGGRFTGTTTGSSNAHGSCGGDKAPEAVFKLVLTQKSDLFVTTHGTSFDTVIYLRSNACCGAEVACNDDGDNRKTSVLTSRGLGPGTFYIFVDGASGNASGDFTVDIYATPATINATDNCGSPARIANLPVTGTTCGMNDDFMPVMGCLVAPATTSGDGVYYFVLDASSTMVTFSTCTNTCIDTVLYVRDVCTMTTAPNQKSCNDNFCGPAVGSMCPPGPPVQSRTVATLGPGVHYLVVDSHSGGSCGSFTVSPNGVPQ
jgi:hypothetical protein